MKAAFEGLKNIACPITTQLVNGDCTKCIQNALALYSNTSIACLGCNTPTINLNITLFPII